MMMKKNMICTGSIMLLVLLSAEGLTGCGGPRREKIDLSGYAGYENRTGGTANRTDSESELPEIVIDLEPPSAKTEQEPVMESAEMSAADEEAPDEEYRREENGSLGEDEKKSASEYEAGQVLDSREIAMLGTQAFFYQTAIGENLYERMDGKSYKRGCPVAVEDLRYLRVLHYGYQGEIRVGELVCSQSISADLLGIFRKLYDAQYPIEKIRLIDDYDGDDDRSSSDNNTSCFNYRNVAGKESLSRHALGMAIDINPVHNPYVVTDEEGNIICAPANGTEYADRSKSFPHKIDEDDLCYQLFTEAGFTWGGSWEEEPDYMHFSKGNTPET